MSVFLLLELTHTHTAVCMMRVSCSCFLSQSAARRLGAFHVRHGWHGQEQLYAISGPEKLEQDFGGHCAIITKKGPEGNFIRNYSDPYI